MVLAGTILNKSNTREILLKSYLVLHIDGNKGFFFMRDAETWMTYEWNRMRVLPNNEVKGEAEFVKMYTKILRDYAFGMKLQESWLLTMKEATGFYGGQWLNLETLSRYKPFYRVFNIGIITILFMWKESD